MDLSIGEFEIVGNTVKKFASDDATVVVGTVIDPEMKNQIRVTVVATGLGRPTVRQHQHQPQQQHSHQAPALQPQMRVVQPRTRAPLSGADYSGYEKPTVQRQRAVGDGVRMERDSEDLLDIPAFLRRQAD
jgi:cell division protein FtsZ